MTNLTKRMLCAAWIGFGVFAAMTATPEVSFAQGGCGSFCVPGEVINPGRVGSDLGRFRFFVNNEYANLDGYYEGSDTVANPGNASAIVNILTLDVNVLLTERWSIDVLTPWVRKTQNNRRFGQRRADGLGDIAVINNFSLLSPLSQNRVTARFGFKFATGDVEDPGVVPVKQTAPYRNSSANRTDTLLLRRSRSSSFLTGISDLMVGAFLI